VNEEPLKPRRSVFSYLAIWVPLLIVALTVGPLLMKTPSSSSSENIATFLKGILGILLMAPFAVICSVCAFMRQERLARMTLITAIPGAIFILWILSVLV
jgi:hypothetical protein